jgi:hypothetical protein
MAGYTRQSVADIINGANITAPPLNAEFNQLLAAFNSSTGHTHDGSTGSAPKLPLTTSVSGYLPVVHGGVGGRNNTTATADPATTNDNTEGYAPGSIWINANTGYTHLCLFNTTNNANWVTIAAISNTNIIAPKVTNTVDVGTSTLQFKDIYADGVGYIDNISSETMSSTGDTSVGGVLAVTGNATVGGTLGVTGNSTLASLGVTTTLTVGGGVGITGATIMSGNLTVNGNTIIGNAASDTVTVTADVASHLIPSADSTYDLGATGSEWRDLYIDGTAKIDALEADTANIDGGSVDGTTVGAGTPASGSFAGLTATGTVNLSGATVSNLGAVTTADINGGTIDGVTIGTNSAVTDLRVDNLKVDGNAITSTNTNGNIDLTPAGTGEVNISKVDIDSGAIDNTVIGASTAVAGSFTTVSTTGQATLATVDINGGAIDGTAIGGSSASSGAFTTVTASGGFSGAISGNVTGNVTGNLTGDVTGDVTGDLTGNVTASSGSSTFTNVVVNGTLNMNAGTTATIENLTAPTNANDAATKAYVDGEISTLIGDAGAGLNTLGELADALNDDDDFSATVTASIATKLPKAGGTMSGVIAMGSNKITGVTDPTANQDASTKAYTDAQRDTRVAKSGDTMSGALAMGSNKITGLGTPTAGTDATNKTYVDTIHGSAVAAATSATNASNSQTAAANSASAASTSETNAANSATSAAASFDLFDDRFLGAKSSAPTVDNDGGSLVVGTLYFDTTAQIMKVYGASGWQSAGSAVNGTSERYKYVATSNQTTFSGADANSNALGYDAGFLDVFLSGIRLVNGTDFTATSGTSIQLASGAATGDILEIVTYGTFVLSNQSITDMTDVNTGGVSTNDVLAYNGTNFVPVSTLTGFTAAGLTMTGALTTNSTIDGRDVATDGTKLDGVEPLADVTDATNVTAAGALMDSELTAIASVKALNQGVATTDDPTFTNTQLAAIAQSKSDTAVDVFVYDTSKDSDGGAWRHRTQNTSWYNETLNTSTRGARKEFPSVAVIVASVGRVTIYDGDDPDMPMWMVFPPSGILDWPTSTLTDISVTALNGQIVTGGNDGGLVWKFISDYIDILYNGNFTITSDRTIAGRSDTTSYTSGGGNNFFIVNYDINDVAMTVLPNAPIDADTGLPVPTIAVATNGGVSVIKDDGTVVDIINTQDGSTFNFCMDVHFRSDGGLVWSADSAGNVAAPRFIQVLHQIPSADFSHPTVAASSNIDEFYSRSTTSQGDFKFLSANGVKALQNSTGRTNVGTVDGLSSFAYNKTTPEEGLGNYITADYNTGWMNGDIKLATLSDTDDTNVTGSELVTNGTFDSDVNNWNTSFGSTITWNSGSQTATVTSNGSNSWNGATQYITGLTVGKTYVLTADIITSNNWGSINFASGADSGVKYGSYSSWNGGSTFPLKAQAQFTATATSVTVSIDSLNTTNATVTEVDNISVRLTEEDRSVNGKGLQVFGTVTKTAVATGADLVAYSGFNSTAGYSPNGTRLQQPYNAGYDFTGDFSISYWVKGSGQDTSIHWSDASGNDGWMIYHNASTSYFIDGTWDSYSAYQQVNSVTSLTGAWTRVDYVRRGGSLYYYLDAVLKHTYNSIGGWALTNTTAHQLAVYAGNTTNAFALLRISATAPTAEQIAKMYHDEKQLFQENAKATLYGTSDNVTALAYDDDTELLHVGTSAGRSVFQGLRRVDNTTDAVGSAISASNGLVAED